MEQAKNVEVIFGKGCFALTSKNIDSCIKAAIAYRDSKKWTWSIQDTLCITMKGKYSPRFASLVATLASRSDDAKCMELLEILNTITPIEEAELVRNRKVSSAEKSAEKEAIRAQLFAAGIDEVTINKLVKIG